MSMKFVGRFIADQQLARVMFSEGQRNQRMSQAGHYAHLLILLLVRFILPTQESCPAKISRLVWDILGQHCFMFHWFFSFRAHSFTGCSVFLIKRIVEIVESERNNFKLIRPRASQALCCRTGLSRAEISRL